MTPFITPTKWSESPKSVVSVMIGLEKPGDVTVSIYTDRHPARVTGRSRDIDRQQILAWRERRDFDRNFEDSCHRRVRSGANHLRILTSQQRRD